MDGELCIAMTIRAMYEYGGFSCLLTPAPDFLVVDTTFSSESGSFVTVKVVPLLELQLFVVLTAGMLIES